MVDLISTAGGGCEHKAICTICFEDLKLIVEDLQTLPFCGHVFHELCIQQWLEYCPAGKKPTCPVCKQSCSRQNITRLYFQSTGDSYPFSSPFSTQVPSNTNHIFSPEVRKLEGKLAVLTATFENQQEHLKKVGEELHAFKQLAKREELMKDELKKVKEYTEQLLYKKMEELTVKTVECAKLQEGSLALAKELAALKLATDLNLDEEDMVKLASIGHVSNTQNAVDVLKKSLARRNKSYKELMIQCNILGRSETRACKKLDMAKEKINKLKVRLQEVEKALEEKENEILRGMKASSKLNPKKVDLCYEEKNVRCPTMMDQAVEQCAMENSYLIANDICLSKFCRAESATVQKISSPSASDRSNYPVDLTVASFNHTDMDSLKLISELNVHPISVVNCENGQHGRGGSLISAIRSSSIWNGEDQAFSKVSADVPYCKTESDSEDVKGSAPIFIKKKVAHTIDMKATMKIPTVPIQKDASPTTVKLETQVCESPDPLGMLNISVANRSSGRWRRKIQSGSCSSGDLIVVGADGRGGRIKVLKSEEFLVRSKRLKHRGANIRSQFNIEHFFQRTDTAED